jgi:hypothetical protein
VIGALTYRRRIHLKTFATRSFLVIALANLLLLTAAAQEPASPNPPPPPNPSAPPNAPATDQAQPTDQSKDSQDKKPAGTPEGTSKDRLFFALPNFLTVANGANIPPLSTGQKFKVVARSAFDYVQVPWYAALAGISQAQNSEPGYGQGAEGYFKRFGSAAGDGIIENFMVQAIFPSMLSQDPRFFQESEGGFWHRTGYAVSRIVITRSDSGHHQFNFSEVFGSGAAAAISTYSYHPSADKTASNTLKVWGTQMGYDTMTLVIKEFWPDIRRKLSKKKQSPSVADSR